MRAINHNNPISPQVSSRIVPKALEPEIHKMSRVHGFRNFRIDGFEDFCAEKVHGKCFAVLFEAGLGEVKEVAALEGVHELDEIV